jgi:DNA processing protein
MFSPQFLPYSDLPEKIREADPALQGLYVLGDSTLLFGEALAIVGSRRPSGYGLRASTFFSKHLTRAGWTIVSGLARGIDAAAHKACIAEGGKTIAVLGHGLHTVYPTENTTLARRILESGGCLVSEYSSGMPPLAHNFPARNRIISAVSSGVLVVEAGEKSGSLITARCALEQGRELFVVPSLFDEQRFRGSHILLQTGAKLVTELFDVTSEFGAHQQPKPSKEEMFRSPLSEAAENLFENHPFGATLETLVNESSLHLGEVLELLKNGMESGQIGEIFPKFFVCLEKKSDA